MKTADLFKAVDAHVSQQNIREKKLADIKALVESLTAKPKLADLLDFLRKIREVVEK